MAIKIARPNPLCDERWHKFVARYRHNWHRACIELFDRVPTAQQIRILDEVSKTGSMVSISSGHGTGKSDILAAVAILFITTLPDSRVIMVANKIQQLSIGLQKYISIHWRTLTRRFPWMRRYFEVTASTFRSKFAPLSWGLVLKGFTNGSEESLAGEHAEHLLYVVDEASAISERAFTVMTGALTQRDNRFCMISQPTRNSGYFYKSHHELAILDAANDDEYDEDERQKRREQGIYVALRLNSEESPLVSMKWLNMKRLELGGTTSTDYGIKIRGEFPNKSGSDQLLSRLECLDAQLRRVLLPPGWGWVLTADVGDGSDKSVMVVSRVWGDGHERRVVPVRVIVCNDKALQFGRRIFALLNEGLYPNISVAIDAGGVGSPCCDWLEEQGVAVQRITWGNPCFAEMDKRRYTNQRAMCCFRLRDAVLSGRCKLPKGDMMLDQGSHIPVFVNETGQYQIMSKKDMRKEGIKSPDLFDAMAYTQIADYIPANREQSFDTEDLRARTQAEIDALFAAEG